MTQFGQKLLQAVKPLVKLDQQLRVVRITRHWTKEGWEREVARRRMGK